MNIAGVPATFCRNAVGAGGTDNSYSAPEETKWGDPGNPLPGREAQEEGARARLSLELPRPPADFVPWRKKIAAQEPLIEHQNLSVAGFHDHPGGGPGPGEHQGVRPGRVRERAPGPGVCHAAGWALHAHRVFTGNPLHPSGSGGGLLGKRHRLR